MSPASPNLEWETRLGFPRVSLLGIDEVGRGCLAGPVVAGALCLPEVVDYDRDPWLREVADSKCLTPEKREELAPRIESWARAWAIGQGSVEEIDRINIFHASHLAMVRAARGVIQSLGSQAPNGIHAIHAIVDGKFLPKDLPCPATAVIKGDLQCLSVAAASILAKVWRDRRLAELDRQYPGYGFALHKGYSTPAHAKALSRLGVCEIHRRSFAPVAERLKQSEPSKLHFGLQIERDAATWYQARFPEARVLERNFRYTGGELDLILEEPSRLWPGRTELVFVEVRARGEGAWVDGITSVDARKLGRIKKGIAVYLARYRGPAHGARLDLLAWDGRAWEHRADAAPIT